MSEPKGPQKSSPNLSGDTLKISGKRFTLPEEVARAGWKFETRPGGWLIATAPDGERIRMAALELRGKLGFSFPLSTSPSGSGFGDVIAKSHAGQAASAASAAASINAELTAQFPGKVRKILVLAGARVAAGDPLLLVEAMKMEFAVKAPVSGKVTRLRVTEGQQLQPGDQLIDFEPFEPEEAPEN